jgi:pyruvate/2-oxoglutarate/acetoin dehydrogenase E1 component
MPDTNTREITFAEAVREALAEEMRRDARVFILGEDVAEAGTPFKVLSGLVEEFGTKRVVDTPISEAGFTGLAVGAAMTGLRPVVDIMFGDFITLTMDQMANQAAKVHYATFAILARLVQPRAGIESGFAIDSLRRERSFKDRHSRRKPGSLF